MNHKHYRHAPSCSRHWPIIGLCALLLASASQAQDHTSQPPDDSMWLAASDRTLDQLRGGFDLSGFLVSFGISRAVYINDRLITSTSFQFGDIANVTPAQAVVLSQQIASQVQLVQNGQNTLNNQPLRPQTAQPAVPGQQIASQTAQPAVPSQQIASQTAQPAVPSQQIASQTAQPAVPSQQIASQTAQPAVPSQQIASQTTQVVQNGLGNMVEPGALTGVPLATYIQNTLNNQTLRTQTVIQASTHGLLSALRSMNLQATIREAVANAIGNR